MVDIVLKGARGAIRVDDPDGTIEDVKGRLRLISVVISARNDPVIVWCRTE